MQVESYTYGSFAKEDLEVRVRLPRGPRYQMIQNRKSTGAISAADDSSLSSIGGERFSDREAADTT